MYPKANPDRLVCQTSTALFLFLLVIGPLIHVQIAFLGSALVSGAVLKILILAFLAGSFLQIKSRIDKQSALFMVFFSFFIFIGLTSQIVNSFIFVGWPKSIMAFGYNFSISILLLPWVFWLLSNISLKAVDQPPKSAIKFIVIGLGSFGLLQFLLNSHMIGSTFGSEGIKLDHIGGQVRATSFFKSPVEFGVLYAWFSVYFVYLTALRKRFFQNLFLFIFCSFCVFSTVSRTAILVWFLCNFIFLLFLLIRSGKVKVISSAGLVLSIFALPLVFVFKKVPHFFEVLISPTNFLNRLFIWVELIDLPANRFSTFMFGVGKIQNGLFGRYHELIIDNTYLGMYIYGGILCLSFFLLINFFLVKKLTKGCSLESDLALSFFLAFMLGAFFENFMHLWYLSVVPVLFMTSKFFRLDFVK